MPLSMSMSGRSSSRAADPKWATLRVPYRWCRGGSVLAQQSDHFGTIHRLIVGEGRLLERGKRGNWITWIEVRLRRGPRLAAAEPFGP